MAAHFFALLCLEAEIGNQTTDSWYLEDRVFCPLQFLYAKNGNCSKDMCTAACDVARGSGWVVSSMLRAQIARNWQYTVQVFPGKLKGSCRLQHSKIVISDKFCQWNCSPYEETVSWYFLIFHLSQILNFNISCKVVATNLFGFLFVWKSLYFSFTFEDNFTGYVYNQDPK